MRKKTKEKLEAIRLREQGMSLSDIVRILGVSKSSASLWTRDIKLDSEQKHELWKRLGDHREVANKERSRRTRESRSKAQEEGSSMAKDCNERFWFGCSLYWAEGSKNQNTVQFTNSDADMIRFFVSFLMEFFDVPAEKITMAASIHLNNGVPLSEIKKYWEGITGLPSSCWRKCTVVKKESNKRKNVLLYGTLRLVVNSTLVKQKIYGAIQEMAGFKRKEWLG